MSTTVTTETKLPQLVKRSTTYKLIVPEKVEEKIRYLIRKFPHTEWSGVLFYSHTGTFEDGDLVVTCQDIYPMDLGTTGWTEFKMSEDVAGYMAENIELFDCEIGLLHSHHLLGAYFSGQDVKMIQQEGNDTNCFVSLVVDTRGQYVAIITRKVLTSSEVTVKNLGKSYEFFGEGSRQLTTDETETTRTIDKAVIEYFDMEVERHKVDNTLSYLDDRFNEIELKKKQNQSKANKGWMSESYGNVMGNYVSDNNPSLFMRSYEHKNIFSKEDEEKVNSVLTWEPDTKAIHKAVVTIITCSFIIDAEKIDLKQWVTKHMVNVYKRTFGAEDPMSNMNFGDWCNFIISHTLDYFDYSGAPDNIQTDPIESVAEAIYEELLVYANYNPYIQAYCDEIQNWLNG